MKITVKKRGLSPVIASTLMILLVLVLAAMIFLWARGFIGEQIEKFGEPIDGYCKSVEFSVVAIESGGYHIFEFVNRGNVGISAFEFKMYSGGDSKIVKVSVGVLAGKSVSSEVSLDVMQNGEYPDKIEIFPMLSGTIKGESSRKLVSCTDNPVLLLDF